MTTGLISEVFACGTAAVITPIGGFKSTTETLNKLADGRELFSTT